MAEWLERAERIFGQEGIKRLQDARVIVFGVGGVGGHAAEALARAGIGHLTVVDGDTVSMTNLNRQMAAVLSSLGREKAYAMRDRLTDAAPGIEVNARAEYLTAGNIRDFRLEEYDFVLDCVDQVEAKTAIIREAKLRGVPVISAMGAGNKRHPEMFEVADIEKTSVCPLARVMRKRLRDEGIRGVPVVFSREEPRGGREGPVGSTSFTPGVMGMIMAGYAVNRLAGAERDP